MSSSTCILEELSVVPSVKGTATAAASSTFSWAGVDGLVDWPHDLCGLYAPRMEDLLWNCGWRQVYVCKFNCRRGIGSDLVEFCFAWAHGAGVGRHLLV